MKTIKNAIFTILLLLICSSKMFGQNQEDILVLNNSDTIKCKIVFVHGNYIVYQENGKSDYERETVQTNQIDKIFLSAANDLDLQSSTGLDEKVYFLSEMESGSINLRADSTNIIRNKIPVESQLRYSNGNILDFQGNVLNYSQIKFYMKNSPQALSAMQSAHQMQLAALTFYIAGVITGASGLVLGKAMLETENYDNEKLLYSLLGISVVTTVAGLIADSGCNKKSQLAVKLYNEGGKNSSANGMVLKMGLVQGGLGIAVQL